MNFCELFSEISEERKIDNGSAKNLLFLFSFTLSANAINRDLIQNNSTFGFFLAQMFLNPNSSSAFKQQSGLELMASPFSILFSQTI